MARRHVIACAAGLVASAGLAAAGLVDQGVRPTLRFALTEGIIEGASPSDARAGSLVWLQGIADAIGLYSRAEASVLSSPQAAVAAVNAGNLDMLALSTLEYFSVESQLRCTPAMTWARENEPMVEYVLLARTGTPGLAGLAGKSLVSYAPNRPWALADVWLDVLLAEAGAPGPPATLGAVKAVAKKGHAAIAVFFRQADYAIESRSAFETAVDLNPQLGRDLTIVARSPRLMPGLVCLNDRLGPELQRQYIDRAVQLHDLPRYRQAFMILQVTKVARWEAGYLDSARALVSRQRLIHARR